jgi:anaerobic selenocysteine-containing dehydrogenase
VAAARSEAEGIVVTTHYRNCNLCEAACGIAVRAEGDRVVGIRGDAADPFSRGYICPKAMALKDLHEDPDRLRKPVRRDGSGWRELAWDEALDEVAERIFELRRRHGKDALGVYIGNPAIHCLGAMTYGLVFLRSLGTRNEFSATSADQLPHMLSSLAMFGHQLLLPVPDVDRTSYMLILGANPLVSNGSLMTAPGIRRRLEALRARGGKLVVIDPRRTQTAAIADRHLFIRPGTDALFLAALLHTVFAETLDALGRLEEVVEGQAELRELVAEFSPERVARSTGISAEEIRTIAREFAAAERAVCYGRLGVCTQEFGGLASWLINALNIVTGNLDRPGGAMFTTPAVELVRTAGYVGLRGSFDRYRSRVRGLPEFGGELPVAALAEEIDTPGEGQIRGLITLAGNPVLSTPNGARLDRALPGLDFMVSIDPYINETSRHADIILPPTTSLERDHYDLGLYLLAVRNVAKYSPPVVPRGPDQRHDWEIALELMTRLEGKRSGVRRLGGRALRAAGRRLGPRGLVDVGLRAGPYGVGRGGLSVKRLLTEPHGVDLGPLEARLPGALPRGRIALAPSIYAADVTRLRRRLHEEPPAGSLQLIGRRHLRSNNSWMHNSRRLVKGKPRCTLLMSPADATDRGLRSGDMAEVGSRAGQVRVVVEVSDEMMSGVVSLPHGWGHDRDGVRLSVAAAHPGASANDLTDEGLVDALSGTASFSGVRVTVRALAAGLREGA